MMMMMMMMMMMTHPGDPPECEHLALHDPRLPQRRRRYVLARTVTVIAKTVTARLGQLRPPVLKHSSHSAVVINIIIVIIIITTGLSSSSSSSSSSSPPPSRPRPNRHHYGYRCRPPQPAEATSPPGRLPPS
jgi:hypothetical protein